MSVLLVPSMLFMYWSCRPADAMSYNQTEQFTSVCCFFSGELIDCEESGGFTQTSCKAHPKLLDA